jgi:cation diffusion facilitator CzcD-associated flavoprotein CzcO
MASESEIPVYDVIVIGAGLSGINAAYRLQTQAPDLKFAIIESKHVVGGTWAFWVRSVPHLCFLAPFGVHQRCSN